MVILSRKRKVPRIVKKRKKVGQKKVNIKNLDPTIRVSEAKRLFALNLYLSDVLLIDTASLGQEEISARELRSIGPVVQPESFHEVQSARQGRPEAS